MVLSLIIFLALLLRLPLLFESFWLDEATSGMVVRKLDFIGIWQRFLPGDFHPPLYYFALEIWQKILGSSEVALRSLSLLFALASIYLVYKIAQKLYSSQVGILAALFMTLNPLHVYYSTEARMYMMATFLACLAVWFLIKTFEKSSAKFFLLYGLSVSLIFLTDYLAILILSAFWPYAFWERQKTKKYRQWMWKFIFAHIFLFIAFLIIWPLFGQQLSSGLEVKSQVHSWWQILGQPSFKNILLLPVKFVLGRIGFQNKLIYLSAILIAFVSFAWPLKRAARNFRKDTSLVWFWFLTPVILGVFVSFFIPVLSYFRFIFVLPALSILLGYGVNKLNEKQFLPVLMLILVLQFVFIFVYYRNPRFHREDWRGLAVLVKANQTPIFFVADSQMEGMRFYGIEPLPPNEYKPGPEKLYLSRYVYNIFDPEETVRAKIEQDYSKTAEYDFNGIVVWEYKKNEDSH